MKKKLDQTVLAAGILLMTDCDNQTEFLLMRHRNRWDLPKGHCEKGETFQDTALRETEEETGILPSKIELDKTFRFDLQYSVTYRIHGDEVIQKQVRYFLGRIESKPDLVLTEHESANWFRWDPPHTIQTQTIDPLLEAVAQHLGHL